MSVNVYASVEPKAPPKVTFGLNGLPEVIIKIGEPGQLIELYMSEKQAIAMAERILDIAGKVVP